MLIQTHMGTGVFNPHVITSDSLNAIVDVRLRRHEMIVLNISEATGTSKFKIYQNESLDSLYIFDQPEMTSPSTSSRQHII